MRKYGLIDLITTRIALRSFRKEIQMRKKHMSGARPVKVMLHGKLPDERKHIKNSKRNVTAISVFPSKEIEEKMLKRISYNPQNSL